MIDIRNICHDKDTVSFHYHVNNPSLAFKEAAILRRNIMNNIFSYAINEVIFYKNESIHDDEFIAHRLGQLIPNIENLNVENRQEGIFNVTGTGNINSDCIKGIDFVYNVPLFYLHDNKTVHFKVLLSRNCGAYHPNWNPVSGITFTNITDSIFLFKFKLIGLVSCDELIKQLLEFGTNSDFSYEKLEFTNT